MVSISERLEFARGLAKISARELDRLAHLAPGHTRMIESGKRPRIEAVTAEGLCSALGTSLDWLISGIGPEPTEDSAGAAVEAARARLAADSDSNSAAE